MEDDNRWAARRVEEEDEERTYRLVEGRGALEYYFTFSRINKIES